MPCGAQERPRGRQSAAGRAAIPWEGDKGMRVGKQSRDLVLPWIAGGIAARGGQGAAQKGLGAPRAGTPSAWHSTSRKRDKSG